MFSKSCVFRSQMQVYDPAEGIFPVGWGCGDFPTPDTGDRELCSLQARPPPRRGNAHEVRCGRAHPGNVGAGQKEPLSTSPGLSHPIVLVSLVHQ